MGVINMKGVAKGGIKRKNSAETESKERKKRPERKKWPGSVLSNT